jgi:hypothetical protein
MQRETLPRFSDRLTLGSAALSVSPFCLGMVAEPEAVLAAYDAGINLFFVTADMHWPFYAPLRRGLEMLFERGGDVRDRVVVIAVSYVTQSEFCAAPFAEVLENVRGLDRLDVLCAGGAYGDEIERRFEVYQWHREVRFAGARAIAASFHDRAAALRYARVGGFDLCFVRYNAAHAGARRDLFPHVAQRRCLLYNFKNVMGHVMPERYDQLGLEPDDWRPRITDQYRFILSTTDLDGMLCAPRTPGEVWALARALEEGPLDEDEQEYLIGLSLLDRGKGRLAR